MTKMRPCDLEGKVLGLGPEMQVLGIGSQVLGLGGLGSPGLDYKSVNMHQTTRHYTLHICY